MRDRREYSKKYHQEHKEYRNAYSRKYVSEHKEYLKKYNEQWRKDNPTYMSEWYQKNKEYLAIYQKNLVSKNREHYREYRKKWNKTEKGRANEQRKGLRKYKRKNIINTLTTGEWLDILKKYNYRCTYCGKDLLNLFDRAEKDHIIPISKGGHNVKENIVPACKSCNCKKGNKLDYNVPIPILQK